LTLVIHGVHGGMDIHHHVLLVSNLDTYEQLSHACIIVLVITSITCLFAKQRK